MYKYKFKRKRRNCNETGKNYCSNDVEFNSGAAET